ncbi:MAG: sulfatase [Thermomicrobiales bacterium]|nr:sulfatase [Thermomicrobiales bacterium]MCO5222904.1 sulfatase [Thermomicrobiales bacterium]
MLKPNVLYIHSHDTGRFVQPYGQPVASPHLQALAEEGMTFRNAFSAAPTCSASRAALLTGQSAHSSGMLSLATVGTGIPRPNEHIANYLRNEAGYTCVLSGFEHVSGQSDPESGAAYLGYDRFVGRNVSGFTDFENGAEQATVDFLQNHPPQPFFIDVGFLETHRVNMRNVNGAFSEDGQQGDGRYTSAISPLPDRPEIRSDVADLECAVQRLDRKIGNVLDALKQTGLAENTLIICTTDHGLPFPEMKCTLYDRGIGVFLIMKGPGGFQGGLVSDALVSQIDIFPTICDVVGIPRPAWIEGTSLLPLANGESEAIRDSVFAEVNWHVAYEPQRAIRTDSWKYILNYPADSSVLWPALDTSSELLSWAEKGWPNCDPSPSKDICEQLDWHLRSKDGEELYDLNSDSLESRNVSQRPEFAEIKLNLRQRLLAWMRDTNDPLLQLESDASPDLE